MLHNALSVRRKIPKTACSPLDFVTLPEDQATVRGNMNKNLATIARVVLEISSQTDKQTYSSQYFVTAPVGEVKINEITEEIQKY